MVCHKPWSWITAPSSLAQLCNLFVRNGKSKSGTPPLGILRLMDKLNQQIRRSSQTCRNGWNRLKVDGRKNYLAYFGQAEQPRIVLQARRHFLLSTVQKSSFQPRWPFQRYGSLTQNRRRTIRFDDRLWTLLRRNVNRLWFGSASTNNGWPSFTTLGSTIVASRWETWYYEESSKILKRLTPGNLVQHGKGYTGSLQSQGWTPIGYNPWTVQTCLEAGIPFIYINIICRVQCQSF